MNTSTVHWTPATFESIVQTAQHHGGGWIVFLIHDICPGYCTYGITSTQLDQVLAWAHGQLGSGLKVETVHQVIGGAVKPAVAGPAPAPIGGTGVANADLADAPAARLRVSSPPPTATTGPVSAITRTAARAGPLPRRSA